MKKFISLLSGGLDSPVAAFLMIKKGFHPIFLSFLTSDDENLSLKVKIIQVVEFLKKFMNYKIKLYLIEHDQNLDYIKNNCERKLTCILCKRLMIRIAIKIAEFEKTSLIVTGDILGEQASQTLDNLYVYNDLLQHHILIRPLISWEKLDVINLSKKIGLYEISSKKSATCQYNPQYPETHAKFNEIYMIERSKNFDLLIEKSLKKMEKLDF
jgi:thiamine biosynthesis protein ThiI